MRRGISLRVALAVAAMLALTGALVALWGNAELRRAQTMARQVETQQDELRKQLANLRAPETEARAARFAALRAQGFFATPETHLAAFQSVRAALEIADLRHILQPPQPLADGLLQNTLMIEMEVLHEQRFMDFWRALAWPLPLQIQECSLERVAARPAVNLAARCHVEWLTGAPSSGAAP
jgi:hypothetical protein